MVISHQFLLASKEKLDFEKSLSMFFQTLHLPADSSLELNFGARVKVQTSKTFLVTQSRQSDLKAALIVLNLTLHQLS